VSATFDDGSGAQSLLLFDVVGGSGNSSDGFAEFLGMGPTPSIVFSSPGGFNGSTVWALDNLVLSPRIPPSSRCQQHCPGSSRGSGAQPPCAGLDALCDLWSALAGSRSEPA